MIGTIQSDSEQNTWRTPKGNKKFGRTQITLNKLKKEHNLQLDPCCSGPEDAMCDNYYTQKEDGLKQPWKVNTIFNPPFSEIVLGTDGKPKMRVDKKTGELIPITKSVIEKWIRKAITESLTNKILAIGIIPAYINSDWFIDLVWDILPKECIVPIRGRLRYEHPGRQDWFAKL